MSATDYVQALFLSQAPGKREQCFFLAGYISYEFGYLLEPILARSFVPRMPSGHAPAQLPLADLSVFNKPVLYDHQTESFNDTSKWPAGEGSGPGAVFSIDNLRLNLEREKYLEAIHRVKSYIEEGDTYQVNYTLKLLFDFTGSVS